LEISFDEINQQSDPYQLFLDSVKANETRRKYKNQLNSFLKMIPSKIYEEILARSPPSHEPEVLAGYFVDLAKKNPTITSRIISQFIKKDCELIHKGEMSPNTLPNHVKPIKALLDANGVALHWKSLYKLYPRLKPAADDRAYTREELQRMIEASPDITDKLIILMFSSGGFRVEAWNYFSWKDVILLQNKDGSDKGAALLVYRGDPESYWTFLTPECCQTLAHYREKWKSEIGRYPKPDEPLIRTVKHPTIRRLNAIGVTKRVGKVVKAIGLRQPLPPGKKRYPVPLDHGFRKFFNTMMRRAKVNYLDKEDMMGHSVGLEKHYERYQEEDFERFPEYQKAIPFLTISDEERLLLEKQKLEEEKNELENKNTEIIKLRKEYENDHKMVVAVAKMLRSLGIGLEKEDGVLYSDEQLSEYDDAVRHFS